MKLCVFPNDPLVSYFQKGEIKDRYFNPCEIFDQIDVVSFADREVDESQVQNMAGKATLKIHPVGRINLVNKNKKADRVLELIKEINPDVIRAYTPRLEGWVAARCSQQLGIPFFVSLHVQYDAQREIVKRAKNYKKYVALKYYRNSIEPYTLKAAHKITAVYKIIEPYAVDLAQRKPEILYNRIDLKRFEQIGGNRDSKTPLILSVGRLTPRKNHDVIIKAVEQLDVKLHIIGDGESYPLLKEMTRKLGIEEKVTFTKSVPHNEIGRYYKAANVFVLVYDPKAEGLPMPVLEAMASGLPVVISKPLEELSDGLGDSVEYSEIDPKILREKINNILNDNSLREKLCSKALEKSKEFDGEKSEKREAEIYKELLATKIKRN